MKKNTEEDDLQDDLSPEDMLVDGKFFHGHENILRKEGTFKWTDEMIDDFKVSRKSILHFAENHFYIISLDRGKERIQLYKYQKRLLKSFKSNRFNIVLSSRQSGKTTTITIYALWLVCFQNDKRITIIANKESTAKEIFARIKMAYEQLPIYLKPAIKSWRKDGFNLHNGSAITIATTSAAGPRGSSSNLLIIDEMAHCPPEIMKELWKSAIPIITASQKSQIVVISTPNGTENKFYELYEESQKPNSQWNLERVDWWDVPGQDEEWKNRTIALMGGSLDDFEQEYGNAFVVAGKSVIDQRLLDELRAHCPEPVLVNDEGSYKVYFLPQEKKLYVVGVDVGEGIERSNTTAQVFDVTDLQNIQQVASYASNKINPYHFGSRLLGILNDWGRPPVLIESNNFGQQVIDVLYNTHNYENIATYNQEGNSKHYKTDGRKGVFNHTNTRYNGITNFRYWSNNLKAVKFNDPETIYELTNFVRLPNYTYSKRSDKYLDDRVFGSIWALFILIPNLVSKHFSVIDYDEQGRPHKIESLNDNSELIRKSPLLTGNAGFKHHQNRVINTLPFLMKNKPDQDLMQQEVNTLWNWIHCEAYGDKIERKHPSEEEVLESNENIYREPHRPIIIF
jgi:hypothetical protein